MFFTSRNANDRIFQHLTNAVNGLQLQCEWWICQSSSQMCCVQVVYFVFRRYWWVCGGETLLQRKHNVHEHAWLVHVRVSRRLRSYRWLLLHGWVQRPSGGFYFFWEWTETEKENKLSRNKEKIMVRLTHVQTWHEALKPGWAKFYCRL